MVSSVEPRWQMVMHPLMHVLAQGFAIWYGSVKGKRRAIVIAMHECRGTQHMLQLHLAIVEEQALCFPRTGSSGAPNGVPVLGQRR